MCIRNCTSERRIIKADIQISLTRFVVRSGELLLSKNVFVCVFDEVSVLLKLWDGGSSWRSIRLTAGTLNACARQEVRYMPQTHTRSCTTADQCVVLGCVCVNVTRWVEVLHVNTATSRTSTKWCCLQQKC